MISLLLSLSILQASPSPTAAKEPDSAELKQARELYVSGLALYKQGRFVDALEKFQATWKLRPHPSIQYNFGKCYEQLGEFARALRSYREYLRLDPNATDRELVAEAIERLEKKLQDKGVQQLTVIADPAQAHIAIDRTDRGIGPVSVALPLGNHTVTVSAEGFESFERAIVLQSGQGSEMTVSLRPTKTVEPVLPPPPDAPMVEAPPAKSEPVALTPPSTKQPVLTAEVVPEKKVPVAGILVGLLAVAGGAAAAGLWAAADADATSLKTPEGSRSGAATEALRSDGNTLATASQVSWGLAGAAAATALVLLIVGK